MANRWRCGTCGYRLEADAPPPVCPGCREKCDFIDDNPYVPLDAGEPTGFEPIPEDQQPRVDAATCTGCGDCVDACPIDAIQLVDGLAWIDPEICCGNAACVSACPVEAIRPPS